MARWKGQAAKWYERVSGRVYTDGERNVYQGQLEVSYICNADNLADAKIKFDVGASQFSNVHKHKSLHDKSLTSGDCTAIRRTSSKILEQLSDEAVEFLVRVGGAVPCTTAAARRIQLQAKILGNRLTSAPQHGRVNTCGN